MTDNTNKDQILQNSATNEPLKKAEAPKANEAKPSWSHINNELSQALNVWDDLTKDLANKLSPEQEQVEKMKRLLGELKEKIEQFESK